jgi:hypothetical protein
MAFIETGERATEEILQTHYWKASYDQVKDLYIETVKKLGLTVLSVNDDYCEVFAEKPRLTVTAKIIMQNPRETSIDFTIDSDALFGASSAKKFIKEVYKAIDAKYELKGLSLHI